MAIEYLPALSASKACPYTACSVEDGALLPAAGARPLSVAAAGGAAVPLPPLPAAGGPPAAVMRRSRSAYRARCCLLRASLLCSRSTMRPRSSRRFACTSSRRCETSTWLASACSMRAVRASRSLTFICTGSCSGGVLAQALSSSIRMTAADFTMAGPQQLPLRRGSRRGRRAGTGQIDDLDTAVLGPGGLVVARHRRSPLTVDHGGNLRIRGALQQQRAPHRLGASLTEADVVFPGAALVGVALETHARGGGGSQVLGGPPHDIGALPLDLAAVEVEVNDPRRQQARLRPCGLVIHA